LIHTAHPLEGIVGSWKKYSGRCINRELEQAGDFWQDESYDRILRDEEHLWRAVQYIGSNPDRAGLAQRGCPLWIRPDWVELGWRFEGPEAVRTVSGESSHAGKEGDHVGRLS
jgi:hypothetical protein